MIDTAIPDTAHPKKVRRRGRNGEREEDQELEEEKKDEKSEEEVLINFDKRRKEFEVLAQVRKERFLDLQYICC